MPEPIIDQTIFANLKEMMGADFIGELIDTFCEETPQLLSQLRQSLAAQDAEAFRRTAHSLKSSSANFGALKFSALAKELEMMGKEGDLAGAGPRVEKLADQYILVQDALRELQREP